MFKRFISYYKPHKKLFVMDMIASLLISLIGLGYPMITNKMLKEWIKDNNIRYIIIFGILLFFIYIARMLLRFFVQYYGHMMGVRMQAQMRSDLFNKLERLPYAYYDDHETGKIMSRLTNDLQDVSELAHHGPENLIITSVMIVGSFIYLCTIEWRLTLIIFACVPILFTIALILRRRLTNAFMESRKSIAVINASLENSVTGIRVTKAYTNAEIESQKFEEGNKMYIEARRKSYKAMGQFHSTTSFITDFFNVLLLVAGGIFICNYPTIGYPEYATFIVSIGLFTSPVMTLIGFMEQLQNGGTGFRRFMEIMDEKEEVDNEGSVELIVKNGDIDFNDVSFQYNEKKEILKHVNLHIKAGEKLALVGPSGGGKTTICHLIPRFYPLENGNILIDGKNINEVTLTSLRKNIGIVQQDVFLFNGTFKENIIYGREDATLEEIIEASKKAKIYDYIMSLPEGFDTQIGERGVKLSGGQKQRLSIARVFLKNPSILILDEATSSLDNTTEIFIQQALDELCKGRTTIVVAHRLSTIKNASKIVVIGSGEIKEEGTHEELLALNGIYATLYNLQFRSNENDFIDADYLGLGV